MKSATKRLRDGEPCDHPGCLSHVSHPCEACGRIAGHYPWYPQSDAERGLLRAFCAEIERRAELSMLITCKLEGAHYAALRSLREEIGAVHRKEPQ